MPVGRLKNAIYGCALPVLGKRCQWQQTDDALLSRVLKKHHVVGACIRRFERGTLTDCYAAGYACAGKEKRAVRRDTLFRTASIAKMVSALLVFRLQTLGWLNVQQDLSELLGYEVRNPHFPQAPVTLAMLLSHTSGMTDSPAYFAAFERHTPLSELLKNPETYLPVMPGTAFKYSNFAAGMVGCLLEKLSGESLEELAHKELFQPLGVQATFDVSTLDPERLADSWRVLPPALAFDAQKRIARAKPLEGPDPERHYLLASGNLYLTATDLARLALAACNGANGFLDENSLRQLQTPLLDWPEKEVPMRHGMGLLQMEDPSIYPEPLWGHQGFAYGAVNGVFFDAHGNGFASLNSGASEQRRGHLALINRDLIAWAMNTQRSDG